MGETRPLAGFSMGGLPLPPGAFFAEFINTFGRLPKGRLIW
jgi:hypothetical protein